MRDITLPLIAKPMRFLSIINVIYTFTSLFGFIFVMTSGRPYETTTVDYFIYLKAFVGFDLGAGAALAVMLFLIVLVLTIVQFRIFAVDEGTRDGRRHAASRARAGAHATIPARASERLRVKLPIFLVLLASLPSHRLPAASSWRSTR